MGFALRSWFRSDKWDSFTIWTEKKGESPHWQFKAVCSCIHSFLTCTVDAYTLPGAVPGARDAVVSTAESALMRPTPTGRQISKEAITFHYDRDI